MPSVGILFILSRENEKTFFPSVADVVVEHTEGKKFQVVFFFFCGGRIKTENYFSSLFSVPFGLKLIFTVRSRAPSTVALSSSTIL